MDRRAVFAVCMAIGVLVSTACGSDKTTSGGSETVAVATSDSMIPATTVASTEPPATASSPRSTDAPTTTAVSIEVDPRLTIEPLASLDAACSEAGCPSVAFTTGGEIVTFDSATFTMTFTDSGRTVSVDAALGEQASLVTMGPDDVAYFTIVPPDAIDPIGFLVAVATDGPRAGTEVARGLDTLDQSGDSVLVATATGLVSVGCCGHGDRQPSLDTTVLLPWVSPTGDPSGVTIPDVFVEYPPTGDMVVVRSDGTAEHRWTLAGVQPGRDMPNVVATDDGGALLWLYDGLGASRETQAVLYDLRPDGSVDTFAVGNYTYVAAMHASRVLIATGVDTDGYAIIRLP